MVYITNNVQNIPLSEKQFEVDAQRIMSLMEYPDFDVSILLTDNHTIQQYNRNYRGKDEPTDILSFPFYPELHAGQRITASTEDEKNIGDLIISLEYIQDKEPLNNYLRTLLCHGICHLLGYDHDNQETDILMREKETWLEEQLKYNE